MSFLAAIGAKLLQWALEKLGAFVMKWAKFKAKVSKHNKKVDAEVNAIESINREIIEVEVAMALAKKQGESLKPFMAKVTKLEEELRDATAKYNKSPFAN